MKLSFESNLGYQQEAIIHYGQILDNLQSTQVNN